MGYDRKQQSVKKLMSALSIYALAHYDGNSHQLFCSYKGENSRILVFENSKPFLNAIRNTQLIHAVFIDNSIEALNEPKILAQIGEVHPHCPIYLFNVESNLSRLTEFESAHLAHFVKGEVLESYLDELVKCLGNQENPPNFHPKTETPKRIFLLEEDEPLREILTEFLTLQGFDVEVKDSLFEIEAKEQCMLLVDLQPSRGSRLKEVEEYSTDFPESLIIGLAGYSSTKETKYFKEAGVLAVLNKPVSLQKLSQILDKIHQLPRSKKRGDRSEKNLKVRKKKQRIRLFRRLILPLVLVSVVMTIAIIFFLMFQTEIFHTPGGSSLEEKEDMTGDQRLIHRKYSP